MDKVQEAIDMMHSKYRKNYDKVLTMEEAKEPITITVNPTELEMLIRLVTGEIGDERQTWYDITHDVDQPVYEMAYDLGESHLREERLQRLNAKLRATR